MGKIETSRQDREEKFILEAKEERRLEQERVDKKEKDLRDKQEKKGKGFKKKEDAEKAD